MGLPLEGLPLGGLHPVALPPGGSASRGSASRGGVCLQIGCLPLGGLHLGESASRGLGRIPLGLPTRGLHPGRVGQTRDTWDTAGYS